MDALTQGILIGVGVVFGLTVWALGLMALWARMSRKKSERADNDNKPRYCGEQGLAIVSHRYDELTYGYKISGGLENRGAHTWADAKIAVDLFDELNRVIEHSEEFVFGPLEPGATRNFSFEIYLADESKGERLTLRVVEAEFVDPEKNQPVTA